MNSFRKRVHLNQRGLGVKSISFLLVIFYQSCFPPQSLAALSLAVSPPQINLDKLKWGESVRKKILVANPTQKRLKVSVGLKDLSVDERGGLRPVEEAASQWSLKRWLVLDKEDFWLDPGEKKEVGLTVVVPGDAEAGGHYAGVYFLTSPSEGQVKVAVQVGVIVGGVVEGEIIRRGKLLSFRPQARIFFGSPPKFTLRVANQGNVHLKLQENLIIRNWRGDELTVLTLPPGSVFPQTVRSYEWEWTDHPSWGIFQADVEVAGISETEQVAGVKFLIIPQMALVSFALILLLLATRNWRKIFPSFLLLFLFLAGFFKVNAVSGSVPVRVEIHQPTGSTGIGLSELENSAANDQNTFFTETETNQESPEVLGTWDEAGNGVSQEETPNRENLAPVLSRLGFGLSLLGVLGLVVWGISWLRSKFKS